MKRTCNKMAKVYACCLNILGKKKAYLAMILVQAAYAGMALFSKAAVTKGMNPYVFVAYRQAFATIALAPFAFFLERKKEDHPLSYRLICKIFLTSLFGITLSLNLYTYAINYVSATFASASINTIPAFTFLVAVVLRIERFSIREFSGIAKLVGSLVSLSGAMVFALVKGPRVSFMNWSGTMEHETSSFTHFSTKEKWMQGCLLMLLANTIWASWLVMQVPLLRQYPTKFRLTMLQCLFSCFQSSIWAMAVDRDISSWRLQWDLNLFSVVYCGIAVTGISYWLQLFAVEQKGPLFAASFTPFTLILTAIISSFLWKELLYLGSICGGILLVGGLYCVIWGKNREAAEKEANQQKQDSKVEAIV